MNYKKIYEKIITNAKNQNRKKSKKVYYEMHHILPRSLFPEKVNLKLFPENGVLLTGKEHFICHLLLQKIYPGSQMSKAFLFMSDFKKINARQYAKKREFISSYHYSWYNNGKFNIKVKVGDSPPDGFIKGQIRIKKLVKKVISLPKEKSSLGPRGKKIVDLLTKKVFYNLKNTCNMTGLSKYIVNLSVRKRIPVEDYYFCYYYKGMDFEEMKKEYDLRKILPYKKIREVYSNRIFKNSHHAENITGISRFFIIKSIIQNIPVKDCFFEAID